MDGLVVSFGARGGSVLVGLGWRVLGAWAARRWWPTARMSTALPLVAAVTSPNELRPTLTFRRGAWQLQFALEQENRTPYDVELLAASIEVSVEGVPVSCFEIGHRGVVAHGSSTRYLVVHAMTSYEMDRLAFAATKAAKEGRVTNPNAMVTVHRVFKTRHGWHHDAKPIAVHMEAYLFGEPYLIASAPK